MTEAGMNALRRNDAKEHECESWLQSMRSAIRRARARAQEIRSRIGGARFQNSYLLTLVTKRQTYIRHLLFFS
jgi:hypothetical protein